MSRYALGMILFFAACSATMPPEDPTVTRNVKGTIAPRQTIDLTRETLVRQASFNASRQQVWNALLDAHKALGSAFLSGSEADGRAVFQIANRLRTIGDKPASRYLDCGVGAGGASRTDTYRLTVDITHTFVSQAGGVTALETSIQAFARNPGVSADPVSCNSTGRLETELNGMVTTRLQP